MSGIHRFLSRRDKRHHKDPHHEKVMSPSMPPPPLPTAHSSSTSSLRTFSGTLFLPLQRHSSSSSVSSLSLAFPPPRPKASPRLQATEATVQSSTANTSDCYLLQPRQTAGHLHGLFTNHEEQVREKDEEKKVGFTQSAVGMSIVLTWTRSKH